MKYFKDLLRIVRLIISFHYVQKVCFVCVFSHLVRFDRDAIASFSQVKSSEFRKIRSSVIDSFPSIEEEVKEAFPKKTPLYVAKCPQHVSLIVDNTGTPWFVHLRKDDEFFPTLRTLHKCKLYFFNSHHFSS